LLDTAIVALANVSPALSAPVSAPAVFSPKSTNTARSSPRATL
jgi:hypothetical protein